MLFLLYWARRGKENEWFDLKANQDSFDEPRETIGNNLISPQSLNTLYIQSRAFFFPLKGDVTVVLEQPPHLLLFPVLLINYKSSSHLVKEGEKACFFLLFTIRKIQSFLFSCKIMMQWSGLGHVGSNPGAEINPRLLSFLVCRTFAHLNGLSRFSHLIFAQGHHLGYVTNKDAA